MCAVQYNGYERRTRKSGKNAHRSMLACVDMVWSFAGVCAASTCQVFSYHIYCDLNGTSQPSIPAVCAWYESELINMRMQEEKRMGVAGFLTGTCGIPVQCDASCAHLQIARSLALVFAAIAECCGNVCARVCSYARMPVCLCA